MGSYGLRSEKGFSQSKTKVANQDSYFVVKDFASYPNVWLAGICDGHGIFGHMVSNYISKHFPGSPRAHS